MSDQPNPVVTSVTPQGDRAIFEFEDGHLAIFVAFTNWGQVEGLRSFFLLNGEEQVVRYDSRLRRAGSGEGENQFKQIADGYTLERIAAYWEAAWKYIDDEYFQKPHREGSDRDPQLWFCWMVVDKGSSDLNAIKKGLKELPAPSRA